MEMILSRVQGNAISAFLSQRAPKVFDAMWIVIDATGGAIWAVIDANMYSSMPLGSHRRHLVAIDANR